MLFELLCVFSSHELVFFLPPSSRTTMLNRRQKSSLFCPRLPRGTSSLCPRMIEFDSNLISAGFGGRAKAGVMGVEGGWSGCGVLGIACTEGAKGEERCCI